MIRNMRERPAQRVFAASVGASLNRRYGTNWQIERRREDEGEILWGPGGRHLIFRFIENASKVGIHGGLPSAPGVPRMASKQIQVSTSRPHSDLARDIHARLLRAYESEWQRWHTLHAALVRRHAQARRLAEQMGPILGAEVHDRDGELQIDYRVRADLRARVRFPVTGPHPVLISIGTSDPRAAGAIAHALVSLGSSNDSPGTTQQ